MAFAIKYPNQESLAYISLTESEMKNVAGAEVKLTITDQEFHDLNTAKKYITAISDSNVLTLADIATASDFEGLDQAGAELYKNACIDACTKFINGNSGSTLATIANTYKGQLESLDMSSWTFPLTKSFERQLVDEGVCTESQVCSPMRLY